MNQPDQTQGGTPRCDTFRQNYAPLTVESCMAFAEQLEREAADAQRRLAEVEKERDDWKAEYERWHSAAIRVGDEMTGIALERNSLREHAEGLAGAIEAMPHAVGCNVNAIYFSEVRQLEQKQRGCTCWRGRALARYRADFPGGEEKI